MTNELTNDQNGNEVKDQVNGKNYDPRIHLIRVRNPWGDKNEWRGKYTHTYTHIVLVFFNNFKIIQNKNNENNLFYRRLV